MKKSSKIFAIALLTFFASLANASAREMTVDELGTLAYSEHPDTNYIYVIGEYAFTSEHTLTTQDIMLASRSIKMTKEFDGTNKDTALAEMNAGQIIPEMNDDFEITGWTVDNHIVGKTKLEKNKKYNIRYIDYKFEPEVSKSDINFDLSDTTKYQTYIDTLKTALKFESDKFYGKNEKGEKKLTYKDGKLSGLLLKNTDVSLNDDDKAKNGQYFFALVVEVPNATDDVTIEMNNLNGKFTSTKEQFDVKPGEDGKVPGMVILVPVDPQDFAVEANKKMTLTIDADGDGKEYEPTEYVIDISGLTLQGKSTFEVELDKVTTADLDTIKGWGFDDEVNGNLTLENGKLKGVLVEQDLKSPTAYGSDKTKGYFYYFTFVLPKEADKTKHPVVELNGEKGTAVKTFVESEYDENGNLTLFPRIAPDTQCSNGNCKLYFSIDLDGEGDLYYPSYYTLDYSEATLEKNSNVMVSIMDDEDYTSNAEKLQGYDRPDNYGLILTPDEKNPHIIKATGLIPIDTDAFKDHEDPFTGDDYGYYLAFKLTKSSSTSNSGESLVVKFLHGEGYETGDSVTDEDIITGEDFGNSDELYVLKYINPAKHNNLTELKTQFDVIVDLDGEENKYAPYVVTIDWSDLYFQNESLFTNADVVKGENDGITENDKTQVSGWKYDFDLNSDTLELKQEGMGYKLTGSIKEQTIDQSAKFESEKGYFVLVKIYGPTEDMIASDRYLSQEGNNHKWTVQLKDEKGEYKEAFKPSDEDYQNNFVTVLFRLKDQDSNKKLNYKIDFDGDGNYFLPYEETIDYSENLNFVSSSNISITPSINGKELTGVVYEGEKVLDKIEEILEENDVAPDVNDYRTLDGWYETKAEGSATKIDNEKVVGEHENLTIKAHYNLNVDKFMEDVIADLNSTDETYSDDISNEFELSQNENNITIKVKSPNVPLSVLANTSIPGTIAYLLNKEEIKEITLTVDDQTATFKSGYKADNEKEYTDESGRTLLGDAKSLKEEIVKGAKGVFDEALSKNEDKATLDELEFDDKSFKITIGETVDTVKLVDDSGESVSNKEYTFNFDSDFAVVNQTAELGAKDIQTAISKNYDTIYLNGNIDLEATLELTATSNVTIEPVSSAAGISLLSENPTTISADGKDNVIDVKKGDGTITLENVKVTGGKKSQINVEDSAHLVLNNVNVSGNITPSVKSEDDEMHSAIIVDGELSATNITNSNESYEVPTISVVHSYTYENVTDEDKEQPGTQGFHKNANVSKETKAAMTVNDRYHIIKYEAKTHIDQVEETYYGEFYYLNSDYSKLYFVGVIDNYLDTSSPYDYLKIYKYDAEFDISQFGYSNDTVKESNGAKYRFSGIKVSNNTVPNKFKVQEHFGLHTTSAVHIQYTKEPDSSLSVQSINGLKVNGNSLSGVLTQNNAGEYVIPVTLTSEKFNDKTTFTVVNPNGDKKEYKYSSESDNGIALVSTTKTVKLELEAIKSNYITGDHGKVYQILVDINGDNNPETHEIDYSEVETLEEKINEAAQNTLEATSFKVKKANNIKGNPENFTLEYDGNNNRRYYKSTDGTEEEYDFLKKEIIDDSSKVYVDLIKSSNVEDWQVQLKDSEWYFHSTFTSISRANQELSMLIDVMKSTREDDINAIDRVVKSEEGDHTYEVKLSTFRFNAWLNERYLSSESKDNCTLAEGDTVTLLVTLNDAEDQIVSIKTKDNYNTSNSKNNYINVEFKDVNSTEVKAPIEFFKEKDINVTNEELVKLYNDGAEAWGKHSGSTRA